MRAAEKMSFLDMGLRYHFLGWGWVMKIRAAGDELSWESTDKLKRGLIGCPELAFAHLNRVVVEEAPEGNLVLFAWLRRGDLRWMRRSLNRISQIVARSIPTDRFIDVVILNSAPELLEDVEAAGSLLVENDSEERQEILRSLQSGQA